MIEQIKWSKGFADCAKRGAVMGTKFLFSVKLKLSN